MTSSLPPVPAAPPAVVRHPLDPDPARSTKARAVLALGIVAVLTGPLVSGVVPAILALLLARQTGAEMTAAQGFLTGRRLVRAGTRLAWLGIFLAAVVVLLAVMRALLGFAAGGAGDYAPNVD